MSIDTIVYEKKNASFSLALLEDGGLKELAFGNENSAAEGNVYLGKITRKIELAHDKVGFFVDIDDGRDAFLNAEEFGLKEVNYTEGQSIVVQVAQEKRAEKGARVVRAIQFFGDYIVYCPYRLTVEASPRIEDKDKLAEYKDKVLEHTTGQEGWILRTASVEVPFEKIAAEMEKLRNTYDEVRMKARTAKAPALLYAKTAPLYEEINRYLSGLQKVIVNNHNLENELREKFAAQFEVEYMNDPFVALGLEDAIAEALLKNVKLPSGGRLSIEETKACVCIDVDSGSDNGRGSLSALNQEAAVEIARQIRLRNLSGKIIIDFAGSSEYKFLKPVIETLEAELAKDSNKGRLLGLSKAGNVEIVRVRRRPTLQDVLSVECDSCQGTGRVMK